MAIDLNSILSLLQDDGASEHWARQAPIMGDHIRVRRLGGLYYHHGIYVSDDEVIAFAGDDDYNPIDWWDTEIRSTSFDEFRQGGDVEVRQYTPEEQAQLCSVPETIAFARACLGNKNTTCSSITVNTLPMPVSSASTAAVRRKISSSARPSPRPWNVSATKRSGTSGSRMPGTI